MTSKEIGTLMPKAKQGDIRIIIHNQNAAILSVAAGKDLEEKLQAFEKRASLGREDRKNQESQGSIRLWAADILATPAARKDSLSLISSAALWMVLRHWKAGDRNLKCLNELLKAKKPVWVIASLISDNDPAGEKSWNYTVSETVDDESVNLDPIAAENIRIV